MPNKTEEPCEETGKGCEWIWDDYIDEDGIDRSLLFCRNCYSPRNWALKEYSKDD